MQTPVFYTGKVLLDTGIAPPGQVAIIRSCSGLTRRETFAGPDGSFSFMLGDRFRDTTPDASDDTRFTSDNNPVVRNAMTAGGLSNPNSFVSDCELRADLAGYTSTTIRLDPTMNNSSVGIIMLHSRAKKVDGMVTAASLEVPSKARKEYEKGSEQLEKGNLAEAEKTLHKAIDQYPKFAEAWTRLGDLEQRRNNPEAAEKNYREAISSDPNLPLPYLRLAFLQASAKNWDDTRRLTEKLISLDPTDFPLAYFYNAVAEFNTQHLDKAENMASRAEAMDKQHAEPRIELLLATIYTAKTNYAAAATHYRAFLALVPNGPLTERVKTDMAKAEQLAKSQTPQAPAANK
jgi:tetratricopeptide (TPR) repeat protein